MGEWQPIETVPKDGTVVDLWVIDHQGEGQRRPACKWSDTSWWDEPGSGEWVQQYAEAYSFFSMSERNTPTHWMPLPEAPPTPRAGE